MKFLFLKNQNKLVIAYSDLNYIFVIQVIDFPPIFELIGSDALLAIILLYFCSAVENLFQSFPFRTELSRPEILFIICLK